jgi:hypothetical protein
MSTRSPDLEEDVQPVTQDPMNGKRAGQQGFLNVQGTDHDELTGKGLFGQGRGGKTNTEDIRGRGSKRVNRKFLKNNGHHRVIGRLLF